MSADPFHGHSELALSCPICHDTLPLRIVHQDDAKDRDVVLLARRIFAEAPDKADAVLAFSERHRDHDWQIIALMPLSGAPPTNPS